MADGMTQNEIDEISDAFADAWEGYFGQEMYHVPFDELVRPHSLYGESKRKSYLFDQRTLFHGTMKETSVTEQQELMGREYKRQFEMTLVTKELRDSGVNSISTRDIVEVTDRDGNTRYFNILSDYGKVQLTNNRIFTKLKVVEIDV